MATNTQVRQATVYNPSTGARKVVNVGDPQAFAGGFVLETPTSNLQTRSLTPALGAPPAPATPPAPTRTLTAFDPSTVKPAPTGTYGRTMAEANDPVNWNNGKYVPPVGVPQNTPTPPEKPAQTPQESFYAAMTSLLKGSPTSVDEDLQKQRGALINQRFNAVNDTTPEAMRVLTPAQQASLRSESAGAVQEQLTGVSSALSSRSTARDEARSTAKDLSGLINTSAADAPKTIETSVGTLTWNGSAWEPVTVNGENVGPKPTSTGTTITEVGGKKLLINDTTGATIAVLGDAPQDKPPASYQEWLLSGSPGTYAEFLAKKNVKPSTADETKNAGFAIRAKASNDILGELEKTNPAAGVNGAMQSLIPESALTNWLKSPEYKQMEQAQRDFVNSILRRESGAVISPSEFQNARLQYFPQPGDDEKTLAQKKANRVNALQGLVLGAGNALSDGFLSETSKNDDPLGILGKPSVGTDTKSGAVSVSIPKSSRLAFINNNPGNLRFVGQAGASQGEGGFARFESPTDGYEALHHQISLDASRGLTLQQFVYKYAPPTENNSAQYLQQMIAATGAGPNTPLASIDKETVARAFARKESSTMIG